MEPASSHVGTAADYGAAAVGAAVTVLSLLNLLNAMLSLGVACLTIVLLALRIRAHFKPLIWNGVNRRHADSD